MCREEHKKGKSVKLDGKVDVKIYHNLTLSMHLRIAFESSYIYSLNKVFMSNHVYFSLHLHVFTCLSLSPSLSLYIYNILSIYPTIYQSINHSISFFSTVLKYKFDFQHSMAFIKENKRVMTGVNNIMEKISNVKSENLETLRRTIAPVQEKITIFIRFAEERSQKYVK